MATFWHTPSTNYRPLCGVGMIANHGVTPVVADVTCRSCRSRMNAVEEDAIPRRILATDAQEGDLLYVPRTGLTSRLDQRDEWDALVNTRDCHFGGPQDEVVLLHRPDPTPPVGYPPGTLLMPGAIVRGQRYDGVLLRDEDGLWVSATPVDGARLHEDHHITDAAVAVAIPRDLDA